MSTRSAPARDIRYQQPFGQANKLKTLETDANAVKAAILLHQATGEARYLQSAITHYAAIRAHFLDPACRSTASTSSTTGAPARSCHTASSPR